MRGQVDSFGRALLPVTLYASEETTGTEINAWIDTGFNGELVLPQPFIDELKLPPSGTINAVLADGTQVTLKRYHCWIDWMGERRELEVVNNQGDHPLLGVGLLIGHDLRISYRNGEIEIE